MESRRRPLARWVVRLGFATALVGAANPGAAELGERFEHRAAGFSVARPTDWAATGDPAAADPPSTRLTDAELAKRLSAPAGLLLVSLDRRSTPPSPVEPSLQATLRPLGPLAGRPALEFLRLVAPDLGKLFVEFRLTEEPHEVEVGGRRGAALGFDYTLVTLDDRRYAIRARTVVVPRGALVFVLGTSHLEGEERAVAGLEELLASVRIAD